MAFVLKIPQCCEEKKPKRKKKGRRTKGERKKIHRRGKRRKPRKKRFLNPLNTQGENKKWL